MPRVWFEGDASRSDRRGGLHPAAVRESMGLAGSHLPRVIAGRLHEYHRVSSYPNLTHIPLAPLPVSHSNKDAPYARIHPPIHPSVHLFLFPAPAPPPMRAAPIFSSPFSSSRPQPSALRSEFEGSRFPAHLELGCQRP
jgi:hypothetical protein